MADMTIEEIFAHIDALLKDEKINEVEPYLLQKLNEAGEAEEYGIYIALQNELVDFYRSTSQFEKALRSGEDVLLLMEELQMEGTEHFGAALLNTASTYHAAAKYKEAEELYRRALSVLGDKKEYETERAAILTNLALTDLELGRAEEARTLFEEAAALFEKNSENTETHYSAALAGLGEAYYRLGQYTEALAAYEKALTVIKGLFGENQSYALVCDNCAAVCEALKDEEKQTYYQKKSEEIMKAAKQ